MRAVRPLVALLVAITSLVLVDDARADFGLKVKTANVRIGGTLRGQGNGGGMPVYLVPASRAPRVFRCRTPRGPTYCYRRTRKPPRAPYVLLGRMPRDRTSAFAPRPFAFRVPAVAPGRYGVVLWCKTCRGSLFLAGESTRGFQIVTIRRT